MSTVKCYRCQKFGYYANNDCDSVVYNKNGQVRLDNKTNYTSDLGINLINGLDYCTMMVTDN